MTTIPQEPPPIAVNRPALVWVISIFYFLSAGWVILSFALIHSGTIPLNEAQKEYFRSQTILDYGSTLVIGVSNLVGAVLLLALKKPAFHLFATAFGVGLALTVYQIFAKNWLGAIGGPGLVGAVIGWGISIAIISYSKRLISRGVLR
jgi:hypothetical protein